MKELRGYKNCKIVLSDRIIESGFICFDKGLIHSFGNINDAGKDILQTLEDASENNILPGFIDIHCHGGAGSDVMDATLEAIKTISEYHAAGGTTGFLATSTSESQEDILKAINVAVKNKDNTSGAQILGMHLEGPYFNQSKKGCHRDNQVRNPDKKEYTRFLEAGFIKHMTLAPELPGADQLIEALVKNGATASLGHSEASYKQVVNAIKHGASHVTHMYCAMSGIIKNGYDRSGGMVEATLLEDALTTEVIADGKHLPDELIKLVIKAKGTERVCVVTDANRGAGMPDGIYTFGSMKGTQAIVKDGMAVTMDKSGMASSIYRMIDMFHHMVKTIGIDLISAAKMFSSNPAKIIHVDQITGNIAKGKQADIIMLDKAFHLINTIAKGRIIK